MPVLSCSRRRFLASAAGVAAASPLILTRSASSIVANEKMNVAVIGVKGRGWANLMAVRQENIVALCDVDETRLGQASAELPDAARYADFREMLSARDDIEAVVVSTPDHTHAVAALMALRTGRHVYCEKPLAHTVEEVRLMQAAAAETGLATQMGTQIHAGNNYRRVVELIRSGAIGTVRSVHVWCGKSWSNGRYGPQKPTPPNLDWDLWLGPAPARPYADGLHPANWRRFWDYGTGTLGDMGCHYLDLVHWGLELPSPTAIRTLGPARHTDGTPDSLIVEWTYPEGDGRAPVTVTWYDGRNRPSILQGLRHADGSPVQWGDGHLWVGDDGFLLSDYGRHMLLPESKFTDFTAPEQTIPNSIGHHAEWLQACRTGAPTTCNFAYAGGLTESVLLGNVAYRVGRPVKWDGPNMRALDAPEAAPYVSTPARDGWITRV